MLTFLGLLLRQTLGQAASVPMAVSVCSMFALVSGSFAEVLLLLLWIHARWAVRVCVCMRVRVWRDLWECVCVCAGTFESYISKNKRRLCT